MDANRARLSERRVLVIGGDAHLVGTALSHLLEPCMVVTVDQTESESENLIRLMAIDAAPMISAPLLVDRTKSRGRGVRDRWGKLR